jgi:hypothetical protein
VSNAFTTGSAQLFKRVLGWGGALIGAIAIVAGLIGWLVAGTDGLFSALAGAIIALGFVSLTALSVWIGGRLNLGAFYGVVLGGWILKIVIFLAVIAVLRHATWVNGPTLFFTLTASVLGSLAIDSWVFLKARLPISGE